MYKKNHRFETHSEWCSFRVADMAMNDTSVRRIWGERERKTERERERAVVEKQKERRDAAV